MVDKRLAGSPLAPEPVWQVSWDDPGKWHIKCQAAPVDRESACHFHITELDRAKRFIRDTMEGEIASAPDWANFGHWPYQDGAPMIGVALEIRKILPRSGNSRYLRRSSPPNLIIEGTHADLKLQPVWLSTERSSPWHEYLRRRVRRPHASGRWPHCRGRLVIDWRSVRCANRRRAWRARQYWSAREWRKGILVIIASVGP